VNLRLNRVRIDHRAGVERADDPADSHAAVPPNFDFGDLRHVRSEGGLDGDAAADPIRQRLSPAGSFRNQIENRFGPRRLVEQRS
jgi:hypothetical protein